MTTGRQTTLRTRVCLDGTGVHSNSPVRLALHPSDANSGIVFLRTGLPGNRDHLIEANWSRVSMTELCTVIGEPSHSVATVEHLLAALRGLGVDNALIEIDGPEVPIMDGSAADFVEAIDQAGIVELAATRRYLKVLKPVRVERGRAFSELRPADRGFRVDVEIDFDAPVIGRQKKIVDLDARSFRRDLCRARTFGFVNQVEELWKKGFALGSSLDNSVALDGERVLNPEGLRYSDEFVRHKALDAVGDLALAGAPIIGSYRSYCGGHKMNVGVLEALFSDRSAFAFIESPLRRERSTLRAPAFAPELN
ncbi:MAG TPA: UDP-3-O-acyl-N-acetylglucosamine deacetylase [Beijerinckiaceae bacterium]|jgi:UDP-3-O-[3-hydroxymyristoyl] N-acetylglucosamine deacetylase|nr:UDP-3-O-acyl-N-acetylglucosamine deacetylase [Beijerinckiaceae bacterium]